MLKTRIKTACVFVPVCLLILFFSDRPLVLNIAVALLNIGAAWELFSAANARGNYALLVPALIAAAALPFLPLPYYPAGALIVLLAALGFFFMDARVLMRHETGAFGAVRALGESLMASYFFCALIVLRRMENGLYNLMLMIVCCVASEVAGYFIGRAWGRHKLAPDLSPHKTIEGSVGGLAASCALVLLGTAVYAGALDLSVHYGTLMLYGVCSSVIAQTGDLAMSAVKRIAGVKDFSNLLPGHGGLLDRFDGQLFAAPFTAAFLTFIGGTIA